MTNVTKVKRTAMALGALLILSWLVYSVYFQIFYYDISMFSTEAAQPLIQLLELIDYRGHELLPYLVIFFTLTTLSFLYCFYYFFLIKNKQGNYQLLIGISTLFSLLILVNITNKFALLLGLLVLMALLIIYSLVVTVNYLYLDKTQYEVGDVVYTKGPFSSEIQAQDYSMMIIAKRQADFEADALFLESDIYQEELNSYYVDIYVERITADSK